MFSLSSEAILNFFTCLEAVGLMVKTEPFSSIATLVGEGGSFKARSLPKNFNICVNKDNEVGFVPKKPTKSPLWFT